MKILLIASGDPNNSRSWSGTSKSIYSALKNCSDDLVSFHSTPTFLRFFSKIFTLLSTKTIDLYKSKIYSKYIAFKINKIIRTEQPSIIIGVVATVELAYVRTNTPILHISDATYNGLFNYYDKYLKVWEWSKLNSNHLEQLAINNATYIILPSQWATQSVILDYNCNKQKIKTIPFGPNLPSSKYIPIEKSVGLNKPCKLLFVGVDWARKGGDVALKTMLRLRSRGIDATLQVIGCVPPRNVSSSYMAVTRNLDKQDPNQYQELIDHFLDSTLFLLPTKAEAFGIVFAEAAMFGLPSISYNTGGVSSVIEQGETGQLLPLESTGNDFARVVESLIKDEELYQKMSENCRLKYQTQLNWQKWTHEMSEIIATTIAENN